MITQDRMRLYCLGSDQRDWYHDALSAIAAHVDDAEFFAGLIAATSPRQLVRINIYMAYRAYRQIQLGEPLRGFLTNHLPNIRRVMTQQPLSGIKVTQFYRAICGDVHAVPVDRWMARIYGLSDRVAPPDHRRIMAKIRREAEEIGVPARDYQAALWCGIKRRTGIVTEELAPLRTVIHDVFQLERQQDLFTED